MSKERCSECEAQNGVPCPWHRREPDYTFSEESKGRWLVETDDKHRTPDFFRRMSTADYDPSELARSPWPAPGRTVESASHEPEEEFVEVPPKPFKPKRKKRKKSKPKKNKED